MPVAFARIDMPLLPPLGEAAGGTDPGLLHFHWGRNLIVEEDMPAKSKAQQKAAGAALAAKRGDMKKSDLQGASKSMEKSMSEKELHDMASSKRKGKPEHNSKS
jgi:hypothetical protein